jgi:hypothetical protein
MLELSHKVRESHYMGGLLKILTSKWAARFTAHLLVKISAHSMPKWTMTGPEGPRYPSRKGENS